MLTPSNRIRLITNQLAPLIYERISFNTHPRCYVTQSIIVERVCHHCGRPMSQEVPVFHPLEIELITRIFRANLYENVEYGFLDEDFFTDKKGIHCEYCNHYHRSYGWFLASFIFLVLIMSFVAFFLWYAGKIQSISASTQVGLSKLLIALACLGLLSSIFSVSRIKPIRRKNAPPFPVIGRTPIVEIKENLVAAVKLNEEGVYSESIEKREGELNYTVRISSTDIARYNAFKRNFNIQQIGKHQYDGGFILFKSKNSIEFNRLRTEHTNVIHLKKSSISPSFESFAEANQWKWEVKDIYEIIPNETDSMYLPIQLIPNIVSETNKPRALEFRLQVDRTLCLSEKKEPPRVQELRIYCPVALKNVRKTDPPLLLERNRSNELDLIWGNILLNQGETDEHMFTKTFHVLFNEPVEPSMEFHGRLKLLLSGNTSGLYDFRFFYPTGNERLNEKSSVYAQTEITIDFELVLQKANLSSPYTNALDPIETSLLPNHTNINKLVARLSRNGAYIQRVVENPPHTNISNAKVHNRYWDIAGRYYVGVFSVDFHILVTGHEKYEDRDLAQIGISTFNVNIQTTIIDDKESLTEVNRIENEIKEVIKSLDNQIV